MCRASARSGTLTAYCLLLLENDEAIKRNENTVDDAKGSDNGNKKANESKK